MSLLTNFQDFATAVNVALDRIKAVIAKKADKTEIPTVPTDVSAFNNDVGYLTRHQDISGKQDRLTAGAGIDITNNVLSAKGYQLIKSMTTDFNGDVLIELDKPIKSCVIIAKINKAATATATMIVEVSKKNSGEYPQVMSRATGNNNGVLEYVKIKFFGSVISTESQHAVTQTPDGGSATASSYLNNDSSLTDFDEIYFSFSGNTTQAAGSEFSIYSKE